MSDYEILDRSVGYDGYFRVDVYRLRYKRYDGRWSKVIRREVFERGHAAAVLPYDPVRDEVVLIEQFRVGALEAPGTPWLLEIVAGIIEGDETPEEVIRREAVEEAGLEIEDVIPISEVLVSPGGTSERVSLFCGRVDAAKAGGIHGVAAEAEDIRVRPMPFATAIAEMARREANTAILAITMQWLTINREQVRAAWGGAPSPMGPRPAA